MSRKKNCCKRKKTPGKDFVESSRLIGSQLTPNLLAGRGPYLLQARRFLHLPFAGQAFVAQAAPNLPSLPFSAYFHLQYRVHCPLPVPDPIFPQHHLPPFLPGPYPLPPILEAPTLSFCTSSLQINGNHKKYDKFSSGKLTGNCTCKFEN
jgi:hypothetical protein